MTSTSYHLAVQLNSGSVCPFWLSSQPLTFYLTPLSCLYDRALTSRIRAAPCWKCTGTVPTQTHKGLFMLYRSICMKVLTGRIDDCYFLPFTALTEAEHVMCCIMEASWVFHWLYSDLCPEFQHISHWMVLFSNTDALLCLGVMS